MSSIERDNELIEKATEPLVKRVKELEALAKEHIDSINELVGEDAAMEYLANDEKTLYCRIKRLLEATTNE